jgi:hypothetical protein
MVNNITSTSYENDGGRRTTDGGLSFVVVRRMRVLSPLKMTADGGPRTMDNFHSSWCAVPMLNSFENDGGRRTTDDGFSFMVVRHRACGLLRE